MVQTLVIKNVGIGLRHQHLQQVIDEQPDIDWFEVHSENFFYDNLATYQLEQIADKYPLSFHGVGLSLGSADTLNQQHLQNLKNAIERFKPDLISDHLSWSSIDGHYLNDLLPMPYSKESLQHFADKIKQTQDFLGRQILIENPSSYLQFKHSSISEWDFFAALPDLSGCALLLDVNNIYVSCVNHKYQPQDYLNAINADDVAEIHLAGHTKKVLENGTILIDDHSKKISNEVWLLYRKTLEKIGNKPTLIEWDSNIPKLSVLLSEANKAQRYLDA
ncbi:conserved hypothetical protein [endosymbiont of Bathymodiolus septemdierum str. Myojin knoll]|uniref:Uncharacterized protein n=1 Tax=endosymbiont of Bathymodiolus septemdierum str. Myojin knoll TaxID=1303921 RepID=A0A0P0URL9_9GAMM|nr:conserved hypothetical protein [endosymbiont of Bathymodiolus septemdierum str. Myojin knoll]